MVFEGVIERRRVAAMRCSTKGYAMAITSKRSASATSRFCAGAIRRFAGSTFAFLLALAVQTDASAQTAATDVTPGMGIAQAQTATGRNGMVATQEALATRVGVDILSRGGNAWTPQSRSALRWR